MVLKESLLNANHLFFFLFVVSAIFTIAREIDDLDSGRGTLRREGRGRRDSKSLFGGAFWGLEERRRKRVKGNLSVFIAIQKDGRIRKR